MDSQLRQKLTQLQNDLEQISASDDESQQLLEQLRRDIQAVLQEPNPTAHKSLHDRLGQAITRYENSHPEFTLTLKQVLDNLAQV